MLQTLEHQRVDIAFQIVAVQVEAYQEEARLIGFSDISSAYRKQRRYYEKQGSVYRRND